MAVDAFLKIAGIDGESEDDEYGKHIEILSFSWGESNSGTHAYGGGGGAGKVNMQDFTFVKLVDKASMNLAKYCANGDHVDECKFMLRKAGGDQETYQTWTMTDCIISSYQTGGAASEDLFTQSISINFAEIKGEYQPQEAAGGTGGAVEFEHSLKKNVTK